MNFKEFISGRKNKLLSDIFVAVLFGIALIIVGDMLFDNTNTKRIANEVSATAIVEDSYLTQLEKRTEQLLSQLEGAGEVSVMITLVSEGESIYAQEIRSSTSKTDENASSGDNRIISSTTQENTIVTVSNSDGSTSPVIIKENTAELSGIVIIAEGGDDILVKNALIRAVQALFNVPANKVEVFKMK